VKINSSSNEDAWYPLLKNGNPLWPGDKVIFTFDKPIQCAKPYCFGFSVTVESVIGGAMNKASVFGKDDLHVVCERKEIRFAFHYTKVGLDTLMGLFRLPLHQGWVGQIDGELDHGGAHKSQRPCGQSLHKRHQ
jgi:hypothetical protein